MTMFSFHKARTIVWALLAAFTVAIGAASAQTDYQLAVGDVVVLDFLHDDTEARRLVIADDGRVQLPLIGGVKIANMAVSDAQAKIVNEYVEREFLVDPMVSLSIAEYRPVFVLGDVKGPGSYPFSPLLTVEQAVGLAGGPATLLGNEEDRILMRTSMRSDMEALRADMTREAVWIARLEAQLRGDTVIDDDDFPDAIQPLLDSALLAQLKPTEESVLAIEARAYANERELLVASVAEAQTEIALLDDMVSKQETTIAHFEEQVARSKELQGRGLTAQAEVGRREQLVNEAQGRLLAVYGQISRAQRSLSTLRRELQRFDSKREQDALLQLQTRQVAVEKLLASYRSSTDRLSLLTSWTEADAQSTATATIRFTVRRVTDGNLVNINASALTTLAPGDVLTVVIERPDRTDEVEPT